MFRILHILSQTELTGSEVYAHVLATRQAEQGHEVHTLSDDFHLPFPGKTWRGPVSARHGLERWKLILRLRRYIREHRIDVIHCHSRAACRVGYWARPRFVGMVTTLHGEQHFSWSKRLHDTYGETVIAVADAVRDQLVRDLRMAAEKVKVVRNPLAWPLRLEPHAPTATPVVFIAGRNSGPKGERLGALLDKEVPRWRQEFPDLKVRVLLGGADPRTLRARLPGVEILEHGPGLRALYDEADIVIGGGRIALEGLSRGCETIAFGEKSVVGWIDADNWSTAVSTNFGDMGAGRAFDPADITAELRKILAARIKVSAPPPGTRSLETRHFAEYDLARVAARTEELYAGARMARACPALPILMYHKVVEKPLSSRHRIFVTQKTFARHLRVFRWRGFTTLTFADLAEFWTGRRPLTEFPRRPLLLTFDDGYENNARLAGPLLQAAGQRATLFLLSDSSIRENTWDGPEGGEKLLTPAERAGVRKLGFRIESHGVDHRRLTECSDREALEQMRVSKTALERETHETVSCFAYPFGDVDPRLPELAREAGYLFAVNTDRGGLRWFDEPRSLFRVNVFPEDGIFDIWRKTLPWYRRRYHRKRGQ